MLKWLKKWWCGGEKVGFSTEEIRGRFESALREEEELARRHQMDPYFTDMTTGRNVSADEFIATYYAKQIELQPTEDEKTDPDRYLRRLLSDLEQTKDKFRSSERDNDGYGIGTLHTLTTKLIGAFGEEYRPKH